MKTERKQAKSIDLQILEAIYVRGQGSVFVPTDFLNLGSREAVDVVLHRLVKKEIIRRLARGIYDFPKKHHILGWLQPPPEKIAEALVGRDCTRFQPTGAYAANILGLSEQVPAKIVFLTDGPSRIVKIGLNTIQIRQTTAKNMAMAGRVSGLLIQALRELGKENVTPERIEHFFQKTCLEGSMKLGFLEFTSNEQRLYIEQAAIHRNVSPIIMEKDFWVCWLLGILFDSKFAKHLVFKGGTSLSKV